MHILREMKRCEKTAFGIAVEHLSRGVHKKEEKSILRAEGMAIGISLMADGLFDCSTDAVLYLWKVFEDESLWKSLYSDPNPS